MYQSTAMHYVLGIWGHAVSFPIRSHHTSTIFNTWAYNFLPKACSTKTQECSNKNIIQHVLISMSSTYWPLTDFPTLWMSYKDNQFTSYRNLASNTAWLPNLSLHMVCFLIPFLKRIKKDHYITVWMRWLSDKPYCYLWHRQQQDDRHLNLHCVQVKNIHIYIQCARYGKHNGYFLKEDIKRVAFTIFLKCFRDNECASLKKNPNTAHFKLQCIRPMYF